MQFQRVHSSELHATFGAEFWEWYWHCKWEVRGSTVSVLAKECWYLRAVSFVPIYDTNRAFGARFKSQKRLSSFEVGEANNDILSDVSNNDLWKGRLRQLFSDTCDPKKITEKDVLFSLFHCQIIEFTFSVSYVLQVREKEKSRKP